MDIAFSRRGQVRPDLLPACARFISWRAGTIDALGMQKVPCDEHGNKVDATDPRYWCSWDVASARGWGVAVVMGTVDPATGLRVSSADLDDAWDSAGQLRPIAAEAWNALAGAGAYAERSVSGRGIHFIGLSDLPEGHAVKRKTAPGLEVYSERRILILGDYLGGDGRVNISAPLRGLMQRYGLPLVVERAEIEEGRADRWLGPEDDDELLRVMLGQGLRGGRMFEDNAVSVAQLWNMDVPALAKRYPAQGRPDKRDYDASAVDAAMMAELSYFTGRDQPRMVRLFERWPGYRPEKYQGKGEYRLSRVLSIGVLNERVYRNERYAAPVTTPAVAVGSNGHSLGDYIAHMPDNTYYHRPTRKFMPAASVENAFPKVEWGNDAGGVPKLISPTKWLMRNNYVQDSSWVPGWPEVIEGFTMHSGVMVQHPGQRILNTYRGPTPPQPRGVSLEPWLAHIRTIYPNDAEYILDWMAFVAQNPTVKLNHALVLGGAQGLAKDNILRPLARAIGEWNVEGVSPDVILNSQFNGHLKCRLLRIDEAKDTGSEGRYSFYDKLKTIIVAPPSYHTINEKNRRPYQIPNLNATVITTNYRSGALYVPADDRRYYVTFSDAVRTQFSAEYWAAFDAWLEVGLDDAAAWLMARDVRHLNPKAPPPRTAAWHEMCEGGQSSETGGIADILHGLEVCTVIQLANSAMLNGDKEMAEWLRNGRNGTKINKALNDLGWSKVKNPEDGRGRWCVGNDRCAVYAPQNLPTATRLQLAQGLQGRSAAIMGR